MKFVFSFREADIKLEAIAMIENNFEVPPLMLARLARIREKLQAECGSIQKARKVLQEQFFEPVLVFEGIDPADSGNSFSTAGSVGRFFGITKEVLEANKQLYSECKPALQFQGPMRLKKGFEDEYNAKLEELNEQQVEIEARLIPFEELEKKVWDREAKAERTLSLPGYVLREVLCFFEEEPEEETKPNG